MQVKHIYFGEQYYSLLRYDKPHLRFKQISSNVLC